MSRRRQPELTERVLQLPELGEKRLRLLQILGVEAFGEPVVDRGQEVIGVLALALALPQTCQAHRGAQLPGLRLLAAGPVEGWEKTSFGAFNVTHERPHPALDA